MTLRYFKATAFRCFGCVEFEPAEKYSLVFGDNASGKTSLLEAISYLGRGRSFRGANTQNLIRHGCSEMLLFGKVAAGERLVSVGLRNSRSGLEVHIDGESSVGAAGLAQELPLQVIDPDVHKLVAGGPDERRRYLDWIAFHVEQGYLESWRRFRRALKQRNAALRTGAGAAVIAGWDKEFAETAMLVDRSRRMVVAGVASVLERFGQDLLGVCVAVVYRQGWSGDLSLEEALVVGLGRDRELGSSQLGPHRGELQLVMDDRKAKTLVSRGQQKLLSCALVLTSVELVQRQLERPVLLLLDDPAAELDQGSLRRLMSSVIDLDCQVVATSLVVDERLFPGSPALFHVEQGALKTVS